MKFHAYSTASPVSVIATTFVCKMHTAPVCVCAGNRTEPATSTACPVVGQGPPGAGL